MNGSFPTDAGMTPYSDSILAFVGTQEEADYYRELGLTEWQHGEFHSLIRPVEWTLENISRVCAGHPPIDYPTGQIIELHHIGQRRESPLAELITAEHRGRGRDRLLHRSPKSGSN